MQSRGFGMIEFGTDYRKNTKSTVSEKNGYVVWPKYVGVISMSGSKIKHATPSGCILICYIIAN